MNRDPEGQASRVRLTCTPCYRRKIKCDKNTPCDTCTRRGIAHLCSREESSAAGRAATPTQQASEQGETIQALLERISQLEARLQSASPSTGIFDSTTTLREEIGSQSETPEPPQHVAVEDAITTDSIRIAAEDSDAATVLEFLAWGRKKNSGFINAPENNSGPVQSISAQPPKANPLTENARSAQLDVLETLLPEKPHISKLVEFHNSSLLWYHGSYSANIFSSDLDIFFDRFEGGLKHEQLNLQWLALLFAVLTGSITCASPATRSAWGFSAAEQGTLSTRWYEATVTCLNLGGYIELHTIYSVQAISTLTIAAHILGNSNSQSVLLATAGRLAQSLGLHRLESAPAGEILPADQLRKSEVGKRVFTQLCTQDWFSIPFSETYALSPRFIGGQTRPLNCNGDDMAIQPEAIPTQASYCNYRFDIAALMPELLEAMTGCNTMFTRYEQVLKFDGKMRKLATASMPTFLSRNAPIDAEWPAYVGWGRRSLTICAAHKIIMIHRKFIAASFTNTSFAFTRRTCLAAAKTILREAFVAVDDARPVLWIEQAFSVAAGIILSLDMLHRPATDKEYGEHKQLVVDTMAYLRRFKNNKIAARGSQLLALLQRELEKSSSSESRKRPLTVSSKDHSSPPQKRARTFNMQSVIRDISQHLGVTSPAITSASPASLPAEEVDINDWHALIDLLPDQVGFDSQYLFDNFFPNQL